MQLVDDARQVWKYASVQIPTWAAGLYLTYLELPPDIQTQIPGWLVHALVLTAFLSGAAGRFVKQSPPAGAILGNPQ